MKAINILLVDDHKIIRDGIRLMLAGKKYKVVAEQANGKEAVDYVKENHQKIDVILMDINMPEMNGVEATRIITKHYKQVKVLALSMHIEESYLKNMLEAGVHGYVLKEAGSDELMEAIDTVYAGKKYFSNEVSVILIDLLTNAASSTANKLSEREYGILRMIGLGKTGKEMAEITNLQSRTIETHRRNILKKLKLRNTAELIRFAVENKVI